MSSQIKELLGNLKALSQAVLQKMAVYRGLGMTLKVCDLW
jgi:hypothetical protein